MQAFCLMPLAAPQVRALEVFRMLELLASGSSLAPGRSGYRGRPAADRAVMIVT
jgi:hypothetical protein